MRTTATQRDTKVEIISIRQEANGYTVACVDRATPGPAVVLEVHESELTDAEHASAIQLFTTLEKAFERKRDVWAKDPARVQETIAAAAEAERKRKLAEEETKRLEAKLAELTAKIEAKAKLS